MARCPAHTVYVSTKEKISLKQYRITALIGDQRVEVTHRHQIAKLMEQHGWNGTCEIAPRDGGAARTVTLDDRIVAGHLPHNAAWWRMRQIAEGGSLADVGGPRQLSEALFKRDSRNLGKTAHAALAEGRGYDIMVLSAAASTSAGVEVLTTEQILSILNKTQSRPGAGLFTAVDPQDWQALATLLSRVHPSAREDIVVELLLKLPDGVTPEVAVEWADDDAYARWILDQGSWRVVHDVLQHRAGNPVPDWKPVSKLRSRDIIGACRRGDEDAFHLAWEYPELRDLAVSAHLAAARHALEAGEQMKPNWARLFESHPLDAASLTAAFVSSSEPSHRSEGLLAAQRANAVSPELLRNALADIQLPGPDESSFDYLQTMVAYAPDLAVEHFRAAITSNKVPKDDDLKSALESFDPQQAGSLGSPALTATYLDLMLQMSGHELNSDSSVFEGLVIKAFSHDPVAAESALKRAIALDAGHVTDLESLLKRIAEEHPDRFSSLALASLGSANPYSRQAALWSLSSVNNPTDLEPVVLESLIEAVRDPDEGVRIAALWGCTTFADSDTRFGEAVVGAMKDSSFEVRREVLKGTHSLIVRDEPAGRAVLEHIMTDPDTQLALRLIENAMSYFPARRDIFQDVIKSALNHESPAVRSAAVGRLGEYVENHVELLNTASFDPDPSVRAAVIKRLAQSPLSQPDDTRVTGVVKRLFDDNAPEVRSAFLEAADASLIASEDRLAARLFIALEGQIQETEEGLSSGEDIRGGEIRGGEIGDKDGAHQLSPAQSTELKRVALGKVAALSLIDRDRALTAWAAALQDPELAIAAAGQVAALLAGTDAETASAVREVILDAPSPLARRSAARELREIAVVEEDLALDLFERLVVDPDDATRRSALNVASHMYRLDPDRVARILHPVLDEPAAARMSGVLSLAAGHDTSLFERVVDAALVSLDYNAIRDVVDVLPKVVKHSPALAARTISKTHAALSGSSSYLLNDRIESMLSDSPDLTWPLYDELKNTEPQILEECFVRAVSDALRTTDPEELPNRVAACMEAPPRIKGTAVRFIISPHLAEDPRVEGWVRECAQETRTSHAIMRALSTSSDDVNALARIALEAAEASGTTIDPEYAIRLAKKGVSVKDPKVDDVIGALRSVRSDEDIAALLPGVTTASALLGLNSLFDYPPEVLKPLDGKSCSVDGQELTTRVITSRAELEKNGNDMGNCTRGYADSLQKGDIMLAFKRPNGVPVINAHLKPSKEGWVIGEVNDVRNLGGARCEVARKWLEARIKTLPVAKKKNNSK